MPRPKKEGGAPPKTRSRFGCWPCKTRKVKCGEEKPTCKNCQRQGEKCDYSIRLNWDARSRSKSDEWMTNTKSLPNTPSTIVFPSPDIFSGPSAPSQGQTSLSVDNRKGSGRHGRSRSNVSTPVRDIWQIEPEQHKQKLGSASPSLLSLDTGVQNGRQSAFSPQSGGISNHRSALSIDPRPQHLSPSWAATPLNVVGSGITGGSLLADTDSSAPLFPPYPQPSPTSAPGQILSASSDHILSADRSKRVRLSGPTDLSPLPLVSYEAPVDQSIALSKSPRFGIMSPQLPVTSGPSISGTSEESTGLFNNLGQLQNSQLISDPSRRASVPVSLLIDNKSRPQPDPKDRKIEFKPDACQSFGYDRGWPDLDFPQHDDNNALVASPDISNPANSVSYHPVTIDFDDYYAKPIRIDIPLALLPLPEQLQSNPMNLLYFHHFLNHTARILTPHDCPANPYRTVLPRMAVEDEDLLNLLLAYSACHRAMLLKHEPPASRIANWIQSIFTKLLHSLSNPSSLSLNIVATSIIFASLEIISPTAFGVKTTWRQYLNSTRNMLETRAKYQPQRYFDDRAFFLCRWFGYLDIIGSLSGPKSDAPCSFDIYWVEDPNEVSGVIDCFFGCTMLCMKLLGQVAGLVKEAQTLRLDENGRIRQNWSPSPDIKQRANNLLGQLLDSVETQVYTCPHDVMSPGSVESQKQDLRELETTNILYHWAGIIQLRRRVLNYAQDSFEVKDAVSTVLRNLERIRAGSPAEACLLFPIFTAGCEATDTRQKERFRGRIGDIEGFGLKQVVNAKDLMERVWRENEFWENLVNDEFIG